MDLTTRTCYLRGNLSAKRELTKNDHCGQQQQDHVRMVARKLSNNDSGRAVSTCEASVRQMLSETSC